MSRILLIGDVFGRPGRRAVFETLPGLIREEKLDFVIVNGENAAGGKGLTGEICGQFFDSGCDVITTGNHARDKKEIDPFFESEPRLLRPSNYPASVPGTGAFVGTGRNGKTIAVLNLMGIVHMAERIDSPFQTVKERMEELRARTPVVIVDFHAEATSEKRAMGWFLDGTISALLGTHTHVPTADEQILPAGTAYITDVGMTGPYESVIGLRTDLALERFVQGKRGAFDVGKKDVRFCGVIVDVDDETGKARSVTRFRRDLLFAV
ncbi:MAG: TIGR00282 family metallophosphoesterase [Pseudomonadota bacterium]